MQTKMKYGSTLSEIANSRSNLSWLWVPGGPGLGSSYLAQLARQLSLPGKILTLDLPRQEDYSHLPPWVEIHSGWKNDLSEALSKLEKVILVGHSFGGMLALSTAGAEKLCVGTVLLDSSPSRDWMLTIPQAFGHVDLEANGKAEAAFTQHPSDATFAQLFQARANAYFRPEARARGSELFAEMTYNHFPFLGGMEFFGSYTCAWTEWRFPTLAVTGDSDLITPPGLFAADPRFASKPNFELVTIKEAGHFPWLEQPARFRDVMRAFAGKFESVG